MEFKTPLARAQGLGSAKKGAQHWYLQRITALALIPLSLWFGAVIVLLPGASYESVVVWISTPGNTIFLLAFIIAAFYHSILGIQVVLEDYVHTEWLKISAILAMKLLLIFLCLASLYAAFKIAFAGSNL